MGPGCHRFDAELDESSTPLSDYLPSTPLHQRELEWLARGRAEKRDHNNRNKQRSR